MSHHRVQVNNVHYAYPDGNVAVKNISFTLHHGESVGIIGANGAGKSTLLKLLTGLIFPDSGEIIIGDTPLTKKTLPVVREHIGLVFQDPDDQLFMSTVYDDVAFGPRNYKLDEKDVEIRVMNALEKVGIPQLKDRPPFRLSGGEKRAAAIATVLSMQPDILVMDEPTSALDPKSRRRFIKLLNEFEHTKIITSHDLDTVLDTCSRVIVIRDGTVAADGRTEEILTDEPLLDSCGLELPLTLQTCPICGNKKRGV
ncbi:MAG: ABC transporter ATP-binding protein [Bacillota bacterium]|nr:ABC transporter ATP-binding protein [Bacillota bacterium]